MHKQPCLPVRLIAVLGTVTLLIAGLGPSPRPTLSQSPPNMYADPAYPLPRWEHPGYGMNLYDLLYTHSPDKVSEMQFSWIKLVEHVPNLTEECPQMHHKFLLRIPFPEPDQDWEEWGLQWGAVAADYKDCIDAYEIGNEPNLASEWGLGNPDPVGTVEVLRIAYTNIKAADPEAIVLAPAVSPTGSVPPEVKHVWDDRRFLRAMYQAGAKPYFDALAAHPFGFKYPPETGPESVYYDPNEPEYPNNPDPVDGLCFRRAEQWREIMEEFGDTEKQIWATEFSYIMEPPGYCQGYYDWGDRWWQVLDPDTHGWYLSRAFEYAAEHWPWMGPMFVFNLDFSRDAGTLGCDPKAWQAIVDRNGTARPGFIHMRWVPKRPFALTEPAAINVTVPSVDPAPVVVPLTLESIGVSPATWAFETNEPWVTVSPATATIDESDTFAITVDLTDSSAPAGTYTTTITLTGQENVFPQAWEAFPKIIPLQAEVPERFSAVIAPPSVFAMVPITDAAPVAVPFTLENTGISPATWSAETGAPWVTVEPTTATIDDLGTFIATLNLTESYFPGGTLLGFHSTTITLTAQGGNSSRVIPVQGWVYDRLYKTYLPAVLKND